MNDVKTFVNSRVCVDFKTRGGMVIAHLLIPVKPGGTLAERLSDDNYISSALADYSHQALIETLELTWPRWFDFDQWVAKFGGAINGTSQSARL